MQQTSLFQVIREKLQKISFCMGGNNSFQFKRIFRRFNGLVLLNISGLALGLASVIFIAIWIRHELSYDSFFKNADRIYRVESLINFSGDPTVWDITPAPVAESMHNDFPEVQDAVVLQSGFNSSIEVDDKLYVADNLYYTNHSYFNIFSTKVVSGDPSQLLTGPDEIVLSRHIAETLFGDKDPIGKSVLLNNTDLLTVSGVMEDSPTNTHLKVDYLVSFQLLKKRGDDLESWGRIDFITYILLKENTDAEQFNNKLSGYWQTKIKGLSGTLFINPLTRLYLYRDPGFKSVKYPTTENGPITRVILFSVIGFVLLLIACINFINLSTSFASQRAKEIGVRKVNGASKTNLVLQLFAESLLQTSLATAAAIILVILLLPVFIKISGVNFNLSGLFSLGNIIIYIILALITGLVAGMYPALVLSSFNPVKAIKPMHDNALQGSGLRKILVVIQFGLAIIFIFCILIINRQINYMQKSDPGFDKDNVMVLYPKAKPEKIDNIAEQVEKIPGVKAVAIGGNVPVNMGNFNTITKWDRNITGKTLMFFMMQVDDKYLDLLDIKIVEGRQFNYGTIGTEVIINETAAKKMELEEPVGKIIWLGDVRYTIIGVVKDFHFHKLKDEVQPVFIFKDKDWWVKRIFVKLEPGNHQKVADKVVDLVKENTPGIPVRYIFLDQEVNKYYDDERRLGTLINAATYLTIVISCIGLFSLTAFTIRKKRKEIGIRKAYGATIPAVFFLLQKDFGKLVLISSIIALPAGYFIIREWLSSYADHIRLSPVYFLAAILINVMISALTLVFNTLKAANLNPADTLRNE
jgi:putative ABC transport system permease protein